MKLTYYILIFLGIFTASCSNTKIVLTEDQLPEDVFYLDDKITPYTGVCQIFYTNTQQLKEEFHFKDGILNGRQTSYYKSGEIKWTGNYRDGLMQGKWTGYSEKGIKIYEATYHNDTLKGEYTTWYSTGVPNEKGKYADNRRVGEWVYYDEAGMILKRVSL